MLAKIGCSDPDRAARSKRFQRGVGEYQSLDPIVAADQRRLATADCVDKMIELAAVCLGIPLEKEMQWLLTDDPVGSCKCNRALDHVLDPQRAVRSKCFDALVIAVGRTPAVRYLAQGPRLRAQRHDRRVDIPCFADRRV